MSEFLEGQLPEDAALPTAHAAERLVDREEAPRRDTIVIPTGEYFMVRRHSLSEALTPSIAPPLPRGELPGAAVRVSSCWAR